MSQDRLRRSQRLRPLQDDEDLHLMPPGTLSNVADDDDDDLSLFLSQTQNSSATPIQMSQSVSDINATTASLKANIAQVEKMINTNHNFLVQQNDKLLKLITDMSVNVDTISSRVCTLEKQICIMNKSVKQNSDGLTKVKRDLTQLQMSVKNAAQNQLIADYENRLKIVENIVKQKNETEVGSLNITNESSLIINNLPYAQKDEADVNCLLDSGLHLQMRVKSVSRAPSVHHNAGILTVELATVEDKYLVLQNKRKLRYNAKYADVYIEDNSRMDVHAHSRIEQKCIQLMNELQYEQPGYRSSRNGYNNGHQRHRYYEHKRWSRANNRGQRDG